MLKRRMRGIDVAGLPFLLRHQLPDRIEFRLSAAGELGGQVVGSETNIVGFVEQTWKGWT